MNEAALAITGCVVARHTIFPAVLVKAARPVSSVRRRRCVGWAAGSQCISAFTASRNNVLIALAKLVVFRRVGGIPWLSLWGSLVPRLSSFAFVSPSRRLAFLVVLLALLSHLGGVSGKVDPLFCFGFTSMRSLLAVVDLFRRKYRR